VEAPAVTLAHLARRTKGRNVTLKTTIVDGELWASGDHARHDAMRAHELLAECNRLAAVDARLTTYEAIETAAEKFYGCEGYRWSHGEALGRLVEDAAKLRERVKQLEAELAKERQLGNRQKCWHCGSTAHDTAACGMRHDWRRDEAGELYYGPAKERSDG
jgi:hypothetical protein